MLKRIIKSICLSLFLIVACGVLSACCGVKDPVVKVNYIDVAEELGLTSYSKTIELGEDYSFDLVIPEGFEHEGINVMINGDTPMDLAEPIYSDAVIAEENPEYRYSLEKLIKIQLNRVTRDVTLDIDMSKVRRKSFELDMSAITSISKTTNSKGEEKSNLYLVSLDPKHINNLVKIDATNTLDTREVIRDRVTAYYGEYILFAYMKPSTQREIRSIYTSVNFFTEEEEIHQYGQSLYCQYDVSLKGNAYYNMYLNGALRDNSRLYYIGQIKDKFEVYNTIPNYQSSYGYNLENDYNKFSLLVNKQKYNSDLLTLKVFREIPEALYVSNNAQMDMVTIDNETVYLEEITEPVQTNDSCLTRYDRFDMYIGDASSENILEEEEVTQLPTELYISVISDFQTDDRSGGDLNIPLNFYLLHYQKQDVKENRHLSFDVIKSGAGKNNNFVKIDKELVLQTQNPERCFIDNKAQELTNKSYITGNGIFYVQVDEQYISDSRADHSFRYSYINYPIILDNYKIASSNNFINRLYIVEKDEEGNETSNRDYGFLDIQSSGDEVAFFRTDKLMEEVVEDGKIKEKCKLGVLWMDIIGPEAQDCFSQSIYNVTISVDGSLAHSAFECKPNADSGKNEVLGIDINLYYKSVNNDYTLKTSIMQVGKYDLSRPLTFDNSEHQEGTIYMSNDVNFAEGTVASISSTSVNYGERITFGAGKDIFYYVASDYLLDFDIYLNDGNQITKISGMKKLLDIAGNEITQFAPNGTRYNVYVKYQIVDIYGEDNSRVYICATSQGS